jgi:acyl-CoA synthetase (AMP-forming)/AMP-acid ligase II
MTADPVVGALAEPISGRRWEPAEVGHQVGARCHRYRGAGVAPGDRVFLHFGNRLEFFADLLAIWRLGAAAVPLDPRLTAWEVERLIETARPRLALTDDDTGDAVTACHRSRGVTVVHTGDATARASLPTTDPPPRPDDDALILFTSGSTGEPKGVVHTHRSLGARFGALAGSLGAGAYRRTLCVLPSHFGHGLICNCLYPWLRGLDLFVTPPFRPDVILRLGQLVDDHGITFLSSVPALWHLALKLGRPPAGGTLERVHCGSAPLGAALWRDIQAWAGTPEVWNAYGITETASWVAGTSGGVFVPEDGLIGPPWGTEIRIAREAGGAPPVAPDRVARPGETGPVWIRTAGLMRGYLDRPDLTAAVVRDTWFATGDLGSLDERGWLHLSGREREEINKSGLKVHPADIDRLVASYPGVVDVCTFGIDDRLHGQEVAIAVVLEGEGDATVAALYRWLRQRVSEPRLPVRWHRLPALPRTDRGKLSRDAVRRVCEGTPALDMRRILAAAGPAVRCAAAGRRSPTGPGARPT